jgi:cobalt-zinc-cadmium efflux system membrane fusion protein
MKGVQLSWPTVGVVAVGLVLAGVGGAYLWLPRPAVVAPVTAGDTTVAPAARVNVGPLPDVVVNLSEDALAKAGVVVGPVTVSETVGTIRLSGVVEPDAYRQVVVSPLVSGRVTRVAVTLGDRVARNAPLVEIYSPDLAEAQTRYLSMRAEFQAVEREIARTDRLVQIGAASLQELERIHAEHVRHRTEVESARARLQLLGMTPQQIETVTSTGEISAATTIVSPIAGVVTARTVNPGTAVDAATPLVTVVDLSTVWVVGDLYERDFSQVSVGTSALVTTTAYPDDRIRGKVAYIDPQVRSETRTARIRIEVSNPAQRLRLGMYAEVLVDTPRGKTTSLRVPRAAVQNVADRTVVFLADPAQQGRFIEREVRLGEASGEQVVVLAGLERGDRVVTAGSFSLRAERERLGLRKP